VVITTLAADFQEFRAVYHRGHLKDDTEPHIAETFRAYQRARQTDSHADIMAGAHKAVEAADAPRFLDPPDVWLNARAWERDPPPKKRGRVNGESVGNGNGATTNNNFRRKPKADLMRMMIEMGQEYVR
jgi:hypothetical protein